MGQTAAYDAIADWYEEWISGAASDYSARVLAMLQDLLGEGDGVCVDLCCGTGARTARTASTGRGTGCAPGSAPGMSRWQTC